jgi:protein-tyrosine phosphatase
MNILMVCLGNICRSPIAEGVLIDKAAKAGLNWRIESAGTNGFHNGEHPHHLSTKICLQNGIDISAQKSRPFTKKDFIDYDLIFAMANDVLYDMKKIGKENFSEEKAILFLESLHPGKSFDVPDPWGRNEKDFVEVYELIDKACDAIINQYANVSKSN